MFMLNYALRYADAGLAVFPLKPKEKSPLGGHGVKDATTDQDTIRRIWATNPNANIGIAMGKVSGILGIDIDYKDGCRTDFLKNLPATIITNTPTGGHHAFFKYDASIKNGLRLEKGATIRSDGYYFACPPSIHPETNTEYAFYQNGHGHKFSLWDGEIAELPQWILEFKPQQEFKARANETGIGGRHEKLKDIATAMRINGKSKEETLAQLLKANEEFKDGPKGVDEVYKVLEWCFVKIDEAQVEEKKEKKKKEPKEKIPQEKINNWGKEILDCRFKVFHTAEKAVLYNIVNISKKEIGFCQNEEFLLRRLRQNLEEKFGKAPEVGLVRQIYDAWRLCTDALKKEPATFTWKGQDEWSFKQLDFAPEDGEFPAWEEFLGRLSSRDDFMAFVWSIFEMKNRSRQFLYLHDPNGEGGKSTVIRVLGSVFGDSFTSLSNAMVTGGGNRWLTAQLYGKRLVAWADCKNPKICMSELIRNITSGDPVPVEFKGGASFNTEMYVKLIIGSNHEPQITSGGADMSRLICLHVANNEINKDDPTWEVRLRSELAHFLFACREIYEIKCSHHGKIRLDESSNINVEESTSDIEDKFDAIAQKRIVFCEDVETSVKEWVDFCEEEFPRDNNAVGNFKEYLKRKGAKFSRKLVDGHKVTVCYGFSIKTNGIFGGSVSFNN